MVYDAYNLSGMGNSTGIVSLMQTVNSELMFDFFGILIILTVFAISFFAFLNSTGQDVARSMAGASFIAFGISLLLMILGIIPELVLLIVFIAAGISMLFIRKV